MNATYLLTAGLVLLFAASGCQKATAPVRQPSPPAANAAAGNSGQSGQVDNETTATGTAVNADLHDDPGMTTERDKTLEQERPSGDESSQAAPNEGDAEPPR